MLVGKALATLTNQLGFLLIGSLKIQLATSGIRAADLQTSAIPPDTRF